MPPDDAKKDIRAKVAAWKRERALRAANGRGKPEEPLKEPVKVSAAPQKKALTALEREILGHKLREAAKEGDKMLVIDLMEEGADVNAGGGHRTALTEAAGKGFTEIVELLLEKDVHIEAWDRHGRTALVCASFHGHLDIAELLLKKGADIDSRDNEGRTALEWASARGHDDLAILLRRYGAKEGSLY